MSDPLMIEIARAIVDGSARQSFSYDIAFHASRMQRSLRNGRFARLRLRRAFNAAMKNPSEENIEALALELDFAEQSSDWYREAIGRMRSLMGAEARKSGGSLRPGNRHSGARIGSLESPSPKAPPGVEKSDPGKPVVFRGELPISIYLSNEEASTDVESAVVRVLDELGFEVSERQPPVYGSWFRRMFARTKRMSTNPEVVDRLEKVERAVEIQVLHRQQAEIDSAQGGAVANLLQALDGTDQAIIQIGSLLIVKVDGTPIVRNLTQSELAHLEKNPRLQSDPGTILGELQQATQEMERVRSARELKEG